MKSLKAIILIFTISVVIPLFCFAVPGAGQTTSSQDKAACINRIFNRLIKAIDNYGLRPVLIIDSASSKLNTFYNPAGMSINFDLNTYDLCCALDNVEAEDAIAMVLSHEIAHFYNRHRNDIEKNIYFSQPVVKTLFSEFPHLKDRRLRKVMETQADFEGMIYARLAGYNSINVLPAFLDAVYRKNGGWDENFYLPINERKKIASEVSAFFKKTGRVLDIAKYLFLIRDYVTANDCYNYVSAMFPHPKIINNKGLCYALEAMKYFSPGEKKFMYPFEMEQDLSFNEQDVTSDDLRGTMWVLTKNDSIRLRTDKLNLAANEFMKAVRIDSTYIPAYINLACVFELMNDPNTASKYANDASRMAVSLNSKENLAKAGVIRGIIMANFDSAAAKREFLKASILAAAKQNIEILSNKFETARIVAPLKNSGSETICGLSNLNYILEMNSDAQSDTIPASNIVPLPVYISYKINRNCSAYLIETGDRQTFFVGTGADFNAVSTKNIRRGDDRSKLTGIDFYGLPDRIIYSPEGEYYIYDREKIIFRLNNNEKITGWMIFSN